MIIWAIIVAPFIFDLVVEFLDLRYQPPEMPELLQDIYDETEAQRATSYEHDKLKAGLWASCISTAVTVAMFTLGGFGVIDDFARQLFENNEILSGLAFMACLAIGGALLGLPFSLYNTFVIEQKYGFNRVTAKTFVLDRFKSILMSSVIGGPILAGIMWLFMLAGEYEWAWVLVWVSVAVISVLLLFLSPVLMGVFNKYENLEEGELKSAIEELAIETDFEVGGIYKMDGSKRSSKANAFFAGFGRYRRIALFDTLIEKLSVSQIRAVLAHEIGHCKHNHIFKNLAYQLLTMALMFYCTQELLYNELLFQAFDMTPSIGGSLFLIFSFVLTPLSSLLGLVANTMSRYFEYQADAFAAHKAKASNELIEGLKILSKDSLSKLQPHPLKAWLEHSHPTLRERVERLQI